MRPRYTRIFGIFIRDRDVTVQHGGSESGEEEKGDGSNSASTAQGDERGLVLAGGADRENPRTGTSNCEMKGRTGEAKVESVGYLNPQGEPKPGSARTQKVQSGEPGEPGTAGTTNR